MGSVTHQAVLLRPTHSRSPTRLQGSTPYFPVCAFLPGMTVPHTGTASVIGLNLWPASFTAQKQLSGRIPPAGAVLAEVDLVVTEQAERVEVIDFAKRRAERGRRRVCACAGKTLSEDGDREVGLVLSEGRDAGDTGGAVQC